MLFVCPSELFRVRWNRLNEYFSILLRAWFGSFLSSAKSFKRLDTFCRIELLLTNDEVHTANFQDGSFNVVTELNEVRLKN